VVAFIGGLYFITHHKKEESEALQASKVAGNGLPPKPEERWRYIKELESRQPGVRAPTEPSAGGEVQNANQLTDEQRQLLAQMQADMRQQPTQLNEVPWNEQTPAQRQQTLQRASGATAAAATTAVGANSAGAAAEGTAAGNGTAVPAADAYGAVSACPAAAKTQPQKQAAQPYQDLLQTPAHTTAQQPKTQQAAPVTKETEAPKQTAEKKTNVAGWFSAVRLKAQSRRKPCARSWPLKGLIRALPPITAGIAW
jgi:cell division protein FtsN